MNYISKQISYDLAHEIAQKAKKVLGLSEYDRETLEHDINNLRAHEWIDLFDMIPDSNEIKKLYFTHCVELKNENDQELDEDMESKETSKQDTTSKLTIDFILFTDLVFDTYQDNGDNCQAAIDRAQDIFPNIEFRKDDPDFEHITLYGDRRQIEKFLNFYNYGDNWKSRIKESYTDQELEESTRNPYFTPYGYKDAMKVLNGKAPTYYYHLKEIEMDSGDGAKLANYAKKLGLNVIQDPDSDPDYPTWYIPGEYHWDDYFYPYPYAHEQSIKEISVEESFDQELEESMEKFSEGYSKHGYSWDEVNGMIHIYEDGKLIDKYPDMESAEEAGWDLSGLNESLDQMREKALKMKENSNAFAILYGYRVKDKEVDLEPEEYSTEEEYKERIQYITNSFTKLSDKDPRGNRYGKESGIEFYTIYPNKKQINESVVDTIDLKWNIGSDKSNLTPEELDLLERLAQKLEINSPNGYKYVTQSTYEDYGSGMRWWNIVCYDKKGNSWQVLNTKEWLDLMNTGDVDKVYQDVTNEDYFQDKQKDIKDMNMGELFNHMED